VFSFSFIGNEEEEEKDFYIDNEVHGEGAHLFCSDLILSQIMHHTQMEMGKLL